MIRTFGQGSDFEFHILCPERGLQLAQAHAKVHAPEKTDRDFLTSWVERKLREINPALLLLDTFPRGILGELRFPLEIPRVLITRWVKPAFYQKVEENSVFRNFSELFFTEPKCLKNLPGKRVPAIVDPRPLYGRDQAREILEAGEKALVLYLGSGDCHQQERLANRIKESLQPFDTDFKIVSRELGEAQENLGLLLAGVDLLVTACGYNTYYEACRAGVPSLFIPQPRLYDEQKKRAQGRFFQRRLNHRSLERKDLATPKFTEAIEQLLQQGRGPGFEFEGGQQIVKRLKEMI